MTTQLAAQSIVSALSAWWRDRKEANRQLEEISALSQADLEEVAADCGVSTYDLITVINAGPHAADEMNEMLNALNIDPNAVETGDRRLYQEMIATCAKCGAKGQCRSDLRNERTAENYVHYCPNADTINGLRAMPEMLAS